MSFRDVLLKSQETYLAKPESYKRDYGRMGKWRIVRTLKDVRALIDFFLYDAKGPFLNIDIESKNTNVLNSLAHHNIISTIQLCNDGEYAYVVPWEHFESSFTPKDIKRLRLEFARLFTAPNPAFKRWIAHFAQFEDSQLLTWIGSRPVNRPLWCSRHLAQLTHENRLDEVEHPFTLKSLSRDWINFNHYDEADIAVRSEGHLYRLPLERLARYGSMDVWTTDRLVRWMLNGAKKEGFYESALALMDNLLAPTVHIESHVKRSGFRIDLDWCKLLMEPGSPLQGQIDAEEKAFFETPEVRKANELLTKKQSANGLKPRFGVPRVFKLKNAQDKAFLFFVVQNLEPRPVDKAKEPGKLDRYDPRLAKGGVDEYGRKIKPKLPPMDKKFFNLYASEWNPKDQVWEKNLTKGANDVAEPKYPAITHLLRKKQLETLRNLFIKKLWGYVRPSGAQPDCMDGHTRSTLDFGNTTTGRGKSYSPNSQQIPAGKTKEAKEVKRTWIADEGKILIAMDFRANEVRWGCIASGDKGLAELFHRGDAYIQQYIKDPTPQNKILADIGGDIHKQTAGLVFDSQIPDIFTFDWGSKLGKSLRNAVKAIIFGLFYGKGRNALAADLGISPEEAGEKIKAVRERFPRLFEYLDYAVQFSIDNGYMYSPFGRRRRLAHMLTEAKRFESARSWDCWKDEDIARKLGLDPSYVAAMRKIISEASRLAKNAPIQSVASDANNIGAFELLTDIEPELKPLSAMAKIDPNYLSPEYRGFVSHMMSRCSDTQAKAMATYGLWCERTALKASINNIVHDSTVVSVYARDAERVVSTMRDCFVNRVKVISEKVYGVDMIAPLDVEFEIGSSYGDTETWDGVPDALPKLVARAEELRINRDRNSRLRPVLSRAA